MEEKQVIMEDVEKKLICKILQFAAEEKLTINNIKEAMEKAYLYMENNATLQKTTELSR
ncbi:hypothetical protein [Anaerosolibacter sp.]|uniref:hypothetical protein n=1 Tax=Anaerosolibacter sp. TaxID=1872527 RepID=UPI0039EF1FD9